MSQKVSILKRKPFLIFFSMLIAGLSLYALWISSFKANPLEIKIYGQSKIQANATSSFQLHLHDASKAKAQAEVEVKWQLKSAQGKLILQNEAKTDQKGFAQIKFKLPKNLKQGEYQLKAYAKSSKGQAQVIKKLRYSRVYRLLVTTDKPLYQPGQTIHIRTLALSSFDQKPAKKQKVLLEVYDGKKNKIFKRILTTSIYGLASIDVPLATLLNKGRFEIHAQISNTKSKHSVQVKHYTLPRFKIELTADKKFYAPGDQVSLKLKASYTFGKPVSKATVRIWKQNTIQQLGLQKRKAPQITGKTDSNGFFEVKESINQFLAGTSLHNGDATLKFLAVIRDKSGQELQKSLSVLVTNRTIRVQVVPEREQLVTGIENILYFVVTDPKGTPLKTSLTVEEYGSKNWTQWKQARKIKSSQLGIAKLTVNPHQANSQKVNSSSFQLKISAVDPKTGQKFEFIKSILGSSNQTILRLDQAVYRSGKNVKVTLLTPKKVQRVFLDLVKSGQTLWTHTLSPKQGKANHSFDLSQDLKGTFELHAYHIDQHGSIFRTARTFQVIQEQQLKISVKLDKASYKPGEKATLELQVKDAKGKPKQTALSLAAVDQAVFALYNLRPDLEALYFSLQKELLKPRYQSQVSFPMSMQEAVKPTQKRSQHIQEAKQVLFTLAQPIYRTSVISGTSYQTHQQATALRKKQHYKKLIQILLLALACFFFLLFSALILFTFRRDQMPQTSQELQKKSKKYRLLWLLGIYAAPLSMVLIIFLTQNLLNYSQRRSIKEYAAGIFCFLIVITFLFLLNLSKRFTSHLPKENVSSLAWSWHIRPYLVLTAHLLLMIPIFFVQNPKDLMAIEIIIPFLFSVSLALFVSNGLLSLIAHRQKVFKTSGQAIWHFISRSAGPMLPLIAALIIPTLFLGSIQRSATKGVFSTEKPEMAHEIMQKNNQTKNPKVRKYFPETLLWIPQLITDSLGKAKVTIPLADSITTWRLKVSAVSAQGKLGASTKGIRVFQPFFVDINTPSQLTQNDETAIYVALFNYTNKQQVVHLEIPKCNWCTLLNETKKTVRIEAQGVKKVSFFLKALKPGNHRLLVKAVGKNFSDAVERSIKVHPDGRKLTKTFSGQLQKNQTHTFLYPKETILGTSQLSLKIYPALLSQVIEGMDSILKMPHGCFEQTSSTTYPNLLVLNYLRKTKKTKPALEMKALRFLRLGYQRLTSFEVQGGGFSLYGKSPASLTLTAYGLMEFKDMSKVTYIDPELIQRTSSWLLRQQKPDGSWSNKHKERGTAYIALALAESGESGTQLEKALIYINTESRIQAARKSNDLTYLSLTTNALLAAGKNQQARKLLQQLIKKVIVHKGKAHWESKHKGVFYSYGKSLSIEVTAQISHAMLQAKIQPQLVNKAIAWLIRQKAPNGTWHTTQATIQTLRTLLASAEEAQKTKSTIKATIIVNGKATHQLTITPEQSDVMRIFSLNNDLKAGKNKVTIETAGKESISYQITQSYYLPHSQLFSPKPKKPMLSLKTKYSTQKLRVDEYLTCTVLIRSNSKRIAHLPLLTLGIPPGFVVVRKDLQKLIELNKIDRFSINERQLTIYMRLLRPNQEEELTYRLKARFPVKAQIPMAKIYLYYRPEHKANTTPAKITVY